MEAEELLALIGTLLTDYLIGRGEEGSFVVADATDDAGAVYVFQRGDNTPHLAIKVYGVIAEVQDAYP